MADARINVRLTVKDDGSVAIDKVSRRFKKFATDSRRQADGLAASWKRVGGVFAAAFSARAIARGITAAIDLGDQLAKTADKVGLSTDALQELRYAADLSGVATNTLEMAMQRFTRRVAEAAQGKGELLGVLQKYNIQVKTAAGRTRTTEAVLADLADTIQNTDSEAERLRISFKAFDSEGAALVNALKNGSDGLETMRQKARDLGLVLDEKLLRNAENAKDELSTLATVVKTRLTAAVVELAPEIGAVVNQLTALVTADWDRLNDKMRALASLARDVAGGLGFMATAASALVEGTLGDWDAAMARFDARLKSIKETLGAGGTRLGDELAGVAGVIDTSGVERIQVGNPNLAEKFPGADANYPAQDPLSLQRVLDARMESTRAAAAAAQEQLKLTADTAATAWSNAGQAMANGFGSAFAQALVYGQNFSDSMKALFDDLASTLVNVLSQAAVGSVLASFLPGYGGATLGGLFTAHDGGLVPPRMHRGGLAGDEVPAILQAGEMVVPKGRVRELLQGDAGGGGGGGGALYIDGYQMGRWIARAAADGRLRAGPHVLKPVGA